MSSDLTPRQEMVLNYIRHFIEVHGYPPTVRDICRATGLRSSSTVHGHLNRLEKKGYIRRDPTRSRAIEILTPHPGLPHTSRNIVSIPLLGKITAGQPILAVENIEEVFPLSSELAGSEDAFMLQVQGDSMIEAGILEGDYLIVRPQDRAENGDIVVALLGDEATVKYFYRYEDHIELVPANSRLQPIKTREVSILGKVIGLYRRFS
ncbi:MAG: repressor LexA [Moorella sp. (in: firmicutes)]|uniref:transcriptional repressor LexA n=1 Tax=unclassified Neomoorella TaxID=2676739 RepID=UPI0010FFBC6E|nr:MULTISPECIES: transcriptional repressor LexA [unclassified Moorella (in: firmicutes)]MDK2815407.1 repressor LexA [Moorella sp. (in: firmicutes)]MDK2895140.1 repressor LexA [Moorella sp. (in: firmicutes)]GEA15323.1 LexA repressor [Moorella sp. E308F]GEA19816.1 LexA repressor [Moorella sp. E306M]